MKFRSQRLYYTLQKKASDYQYEDSDEEVQEAEGGEGTAMKNQKKDPEKDLRPSRGLTQVPGICVQL